MVKFVLVLAFALAFTSIATATVEVSTPLTDARNGMTYKVVKIGDLQWMAENLNYETRKESWCLEDKQENCDKLGRLYSWESAMKACPAGWRLPSKIEFEYLVKLAGGVQDEDMNFLWIRGANALKSSSGWERNGTDEFGFNAIPTGYFHGGFADFEDTNKAGFWSSSEHNYTTAFYMSFDSTNKNATIDNLDKINGYSIRCVR